MLKKLLLSLMIVGSLAVSAAQAAPAPAEFDPDLASGTITIEGTVDTTQPITDISVNILYPGKTVNDILTGNPKDAIAFSGQFRAGVGGKFTIVAKIDGPSGIYKVYINYPGNTVQNPQDVRFVQKSDNDEVVGRLLRATDWQVVESILTNPTDWQNLFLENTLWDAGLDTEEFSKKFHALMVEANYADSDISLTLAQKLFDQACVLQALAEGELSAIYDSLATMGIASTKTIATYNKNATSTFTAKVNAIMKAKNAKTLAEFEVALEEATVLASVKANDAGPIKTIITEFAAKIGIQNPSTSSRVYAKLKGGDYADYSALVTGYAQKLQEIKEEDEGDGPSGPTGPTGVVGIDLNHNNQPPLEVDDSQNQVFKDLDNVSWAKDAIINLYQRGIISGKGDQIFAPLDPLTREQFVVILSKAFGLKEGEKVNFVDVKEGTYYYGAVNAAYNNNITSGISETEFGVGLNITRQDMAVMVYKAIINSNLKLDQAETESFNDEADISSYAKEAVAYLRNAKVINGKDGGLFDPKAEITRAEAAVIINSVLIAAKEA